MDSAFQRIHHISDIKPTIDELFYCLKNHPTNFLGT